MTPAASRGPALLSDQNNLEADLLKGQLIPCPSQKSKGPFRWLEGGAKLDPDRLFREMGESLLHFPVQDEGDIGVEFFLELVELPLPVFPRAGFKHCQDKEILPRVVGEGIEHPGPFNSGTGGRGIIAAQIFSEGNHT